MADENEAIIDENKLSYRCSECSREFETYYRCMRHCQSAASVCRAARATVITFVKGKNIETVQDSLENIEKVEDEQESEPESEPEPVTSMAERAASNPTPDWAQHVVDEQPEPEEQEPVERIIRPLSLPNTPAGATINPTAELIVIYDAFRAQGYAGSISDWVHETIFTLMAISGVKIDLIAVDDATRDMIKDKVVG